MRAVDAGATVGADGVFLTLPAVRVLVSRENAERLRDALNTILPPNSEQAARPHLLTIYGDVEPELHEYESEAERLEAARAYRRSHGPDDGMYRVDVAGTGKVTVDTFTGGELEPSRRCCLCRCDATAEAYGMPVCEYHVDHTEDDPQCPACRKAYVPCPACEAWADGGRILSEEQWTAAVDELCVECGATGRTRGMHS